jgi:hypothetical protein
MMVSCSICFSLNKAVVEHHAREDKLMKPGRESETKKRSCEEDELREPASPPCLRHEIDPAYTGESEEFPRKKRSEPRDND